jgi:uncharacterized protein
LRKFVKINVSQQLKEPVGGFRSYEVAEAADDGGAPLKGQVHILRTPRSLFLTATLTTSTRSQCSRCLEEFDQSLTLRLEEEYFPTVNIVTGKRLPLPQEPGAFTIDENQEIDLGEAVRQYTLLATPMKPVCRPNCQGLCPSCGANLNYGECSCPKEPTDPRWAPLKGLLKGWGKE